MDKEILVPFLSTLLGVLLGFVLGLLGQVALQSVRERGLRNQTKLSLRRELDYLKHQVAGVLNAAASTTPNVEVPAIANVDLPTDAKESALASGRFTLLPIDLQSKISQIYAAVERAREYRGKMLETLSGTINQVSYPTFLSNYQGQLDFLDEKIPPLITALGGPPPVE